MQGAHFGKPYIFEDIIEYLKHRKEPKVRSNNEILNIILKHINLEIEEKGEYIGIREMRKHISWYLKGMKNSSAVRDYINKIENKEELVQVLTEYLSK